MWCWVILFFVYIYSSMDHSHFGSRFKLFCCTTGRNPRISKGRGIPPNAWLTLFILFWVYYVLFCSHLQSRYLNPYPCLWLIFLDFLWIVGCVLICAWGERVALWLFATNSWFPTDRMHIDATLGYGFGWPMGGNYSYRSSVQLIWLIFHGVLRRINFPCQMGL